MSFLSAGLRAEPSIPCCNSLIQQVYPVFLLKSDKIFLTRQSMGGKCSKIYPPDFAYASLIAVHLVNSTQPISDLKKSSVFRLNIQINVIDKSSQNDLISCNLGQFDIFHKLPYKNTR